MFALILNGRVHDVFANDPKLGPNLTVRDVTNVPGIAQGWSANADGTYSAPTYFTPAVPIPTVNAAQAKIQLYRTPGSAAGKTLLDDATAKINAMGGETAIWFSGALTWRRDNPQLATVAAALNLTAAQIDALFIAAAQIAA